MSLTVTFCTLCTAQYYPLMQTLHNLQCEYPDELFIVELNCMAACEDVPAMLIESEYLPRITPETLYERVRAQLPAYQNN